MFQGITLYLIFNGYVINAIIEKEIELIITLKENGMIEIIFVYIKLYIISGLVVMGLDFIVNLLQNKDK